MGAPYHLHQKFLARNNVAVFSSNYPLYGNISKRVMNSLEDFAKEITIYSIDEAFLEVPPINAKDLADYGKSIQKTILKNIGIPVSVGIGATKVLAKMANHLAKKNNQDIFVFSKDNLVSELKAFPVEDIWKIGKKSAPKLHSLGIKTAWEFKNHSNTKALRSLLSVNGLRIYEEINGVNCIDLGDFSDKKAISSTRSFGKAVYDIEELKEAISVYITQASEKLRKQKSLASQLGIYLRTNPFSNNDYYYNSSYATLSVATDHTGKLIATALKLLDEIYRPGLSYKKAGVFLFDLLPKSQKQLSLLEKNSNQDEKLMKAIDEINHKYRGQKLFYASCGKQRAWKMRAEIKSSKTQVRWDDLVEV